MRDVWQACIVVWGGGSFCGTNLCWITCISFFKVNGLLNRESKLSITCIIILSAFSLFATQLYLSRQLFNKSSTFFAKFVYFKQGSLKGKGQNEINHKRSVYYSLSSPYTKIKAVGTVIFNKDKSRHISFR